MSGPAIWVEVAATRGSAPREAGTAMMVTAAATGGTIGGGALEHRAIAIAREMLATGAGESRQTFALGPALGQCCGGSVTLRFTRTPLPLDATPGPAPGPAAPVCPHATGAARDLWLWGAGHVGRAVVRALDPAAFRITWVDTSADRFPPQTGRHVTVVPAADMALLAGRAPVQAHHLVFTYSHEIDFALCAALLTRGAASIGLIGSATKRARFFSRLRAMGLDPAGITCPIGDRALGKAPDQIARGVAAAFRTEGIPA